MNGVTDLYVPLSTQYSLDAFKLKLTSTNITKHMRFSATAQSNTSRIQQLSVWLNTSNNQCYLHLHILHNKLRYQESFKIADTQWTAHLKLITTPHLLWPAGWCSLTVTPPLPAGLDTEPACPESRCEVPPPAPEPPSGLLCDPWPRPTGSPGRGRRLGSATRQSGEGASGASPWPVESVPPQTGRPVEAGQEAKRWGRWEPLGRCAEGRGGCPGWCPGDQERKKVHLKHHLHLQFDCISPQTKKIKYVLMHIVQGLPGVILSV